jgi:hypothetical protein
MAGLKHPVTPDGRYFVVRGRLWRLANPDLSPNTRSALVGELMAARSAVRAAKLVAEAAGERGRVWWTDGSPDLNRQMVKNTPYASWHLGLRTTGRREQRTRSHDMDGQMP